MPNKITEITRQDIIDLLTLGYHDKEADEEIRCFLNTAGEN